MAKLRFSLCKEKIAFLRKRCVEQKLHGDDRFPVAQNANDFLLDEDGDLITCRDADNLEVQDTYFLIGTIF